MLLDAYEFLKELKNKIPQSENCCHNLTLDEQNNINITIMTNNKIYPVILWYNDIKNGIRNEIIDELSSYIKIC